MVAAAVAGSAVAGVASAGVGAASAGSAAHAQAGAEKQAAFLEYQQAQQTRQDLMPYTQMGYAGIPNLQGQYAQTQGDLTNAYNLTQAAIPKPMTEDELVKTPGYQFALNQGLKQIQNSEAAKGLGLSGNAIRSAQDYTVGLADKTYLDQFGVQQKLFEDQNQQFSNAWNKAHELYTQAYGPVALGESSAAKAGELTQSGVNQAGANIAGAGQAQAAGITAMGNNISQGLNAIGNAPMQYYYLDKLNKIGGPPGSGTMGPVGGSAPLG